MQKLYQPKSIRVGFIILAPDGNSSHVKSTLNSIRCNYPDSNQIAVVPEHIAETVVTEIKKLCPCYKGGTTITSLFNAGINAAPCEGWNFLVIAGSWIRPFLDKKYAYFIESERDILFPIVERKMNFIDGSINGILVCKETYLSVGPMDDKNPLEICKLFWAMNAIAKGCRFKAVLGAKIA